MTQPEVSRRAFLGGSAAVAAMAAVPALPAPAVVPVVEALPAVATAKPMFGYSLNGGEYWYTGFSSHNEAWGAAVDEVEDAFERDGERQGFEVGQVHPIKIRVPRGLNESVADALGDCGRIGWALFDSLEGSNEEADYEGELMDAFHAARQVDGPQVTAEFRQAVSAALIRAGHPIVAAHVAATDMPYEPGIADDLHEALASDAALQEDLHRIMSDWMDKHALWEAGRMLNTSNVVEYPPANQKPEAQT